MNFFANSSAMIPRQFADHRHLKDNSIMKFKVLVVITTMFLASSVFAQNKPGKFSHLSKYAGSWNVEAIYNDDAIKALITKDFAINLEKFRTAKEDIFTQIDVIKGNMIVTSSSKDDPCLSNTFMSISLTNDDTVYLIAQRGNKIHLFHTIYGQRTRDFKNHKFNKGTALFIKSISNKCKHKGLQRT